jgi:hypothetical protein
MKNGEKGKCVKCRHANHGTMDANGGLWACPWLGGMRSNKSCEITYKDGKYVFEPYNGKNCTWGSGDPVFRAVPAGYEGKQVFQEEG